MSTADALPVAGTVALAVFGWLLLLLTFVLAHSPGKTTTELIQGSRSGR